jgi:hypothetical protein
MSRAQRRDCPRHDAYRAHLELAGPFALDLPDDPGDAALWRQMVLWMSGICMIVAASEFDRHPAGSCPASHASGSVTPYRGWCGIT